jgi:type IV pilus assembly protein PilB
MAFQARKRFGELLVEEEKLNEQDLERALSEQKKYGQKLGQVLFKMGLLSEEAVAKVLGKQLGIPVASLDDTPIPEDLISLIPKNIARNCNVIPIERHYNWVRVAMTDPLDIAAMDEVAHLLRLEVLPSVATHSEIERALERYYGMRRSTEEAGDDEAGQEMESNAVHQAHNLGGEPGEARPLWNHEEATRLMGLAGSDQPLEQKQEAEESPAGARASASNAIQLSLMALISHALSMEATDIHIEAAPESGHIRMRVDGKLRMIKSFREQNPMEITRTIEKTACLDETLPGFADGRFDFSDDVSVRVSTCPTINGKRTALRLVDKRLSSGNLDALGMASDMDEKLRRAFRQPGGLILCTGSVGSGKTTTLYAIINQLNAMDKAIVTIEDPIEYVIDHVSQVQIDPKAGLSPYEGVRSMLSQDPDILAVGEIKGKEAANLSMEAAAAGITVLSTFCWNDAVGSLARLLEMGLEPSMAASSIICVVSQRLVRKICEKCKEAYTPPQPILESINVFETTSLYRGNGCPACRNTGYKGRTAVFELLFMDNELRNLIVAGASRAGLEKAALRGGMRTMREEAIKKALLGITTLEEALNRTR